MLQLQAEVELARLVNANKVEYILDRNEIRFQVENPILRREFEERVRSAGGFFDTSFSRDVLRVSMATFVKLLSERSPAFERRFKTISGDWLKQGNETGNKQAAGGPKGGTLPARQQR